MMITAFENLLGNIVIGFICLLVSFSELDKSGFVIAIRFS